MCANKENSYYKQATLCLLFSVASVVLSGVAGVLGFVGVFALSKDLFLVMKIFFILSLVLCLLSFIISIIITLQCKKNIKVYSKIKTRVIISLGISSCIFLMFVIIFINIIVK